MVDHQSDTDEQLDPEVGERLAVRNFILGSLLAFSLATACFVVVQVTLFFLPPTSNRHSLPQSASIYVTQLEDFRDEEKPGESFTTAVAPAEIINKSSYAIPAGASFVLYAMVHNERHAATLVRLPKRLKKRNSSVKVVLAFDVIKSGEIESLSAPRHPIMEVESGERIAFVIQVIQK